MELIADILLVAGALGAGMYCFVLARRLKRFTDLEKGVGGAVSVLSAQAEELKSSLETARSATDQSGTALQELTLRAETVAQRLELMMASMHDVVPPENDPEPEQDPAPEPEEEEKPPKPGISDVSDTGIEEAGEPPETKKDAPVKAPDGVMFFRHARMQGGGAT